MNGLIIYGIGTAFRQISDMAWKYIADSYEIICVVDGSWDMRNSEVSILGKKYNVMLSNNDFWEKHTDFFVYITTKNFFDEIKQYLLNRGVDEEHILDEVYLWNEYLVLRFQNEKIFLGGGYRDRRSFLGFSYYLS